MDQKKIGELIRCLRKERAMTQKELAERLHLSEKTISKWECGAGLPDISTIAMLSQALGVASEVLLDGTLHENCLLGGNMKKTVFYICPVCGNVCMTTGPAQISCCGRTLPPQTPQTPDEAHQLCVAQVEDEWFISSEHPMQKEHYICFVAFLAGDRLTLVKQYPEWNLQCRIPRHGHGFLLWYCTKDGLFRQPL